MGEKTAGILILRANENEPVTFFSPGGLGDSVTSQKGGHSKRDPIKFNNFTRKEIVKNYLGNLTIRISFSRSNRSLMSTSRWQHQRSEAHKLKGSTDVERKFDDCFEQRLCRN